MNAVAQRSYTDSDDIQIKIEIADDKIMIFSPGTLYGNNSVVDIHTDNYCSSLRNKLVAERFYLINAIEKGAFIFNYCRSCRSPVLLGDYSAKINRPSRRKSDQRECAPQEIPLGCRADRRKCRSRTYKTRRRAPITNNAIELKNTAVAVPASGVRSRSIRKCSSMFRNFRAV
ncbi:ATP-binding protein [Propionivibrio sp.]|uniref:ATP-binding protein n=1 Tax=Propionivibrio sp. TaxID=2212460 RepID=UPI003BF04E3E